MNEPTARVTQTVDASPAEVWNALTTPSKLKQFFFGADVQSHWRVGEPIRMKGEYSGKRYEDKGEILVAEPHCQLAFSHWSAMSGAPDAPENYHVVTFDLAPKGQGTEVTLTQSNLLGDAKPSDIEHKADYEKNWRMVLTGLSKLFAS
jgi:uncharacterized protein YndB with AHSA1/START domain